MESRFIKEGLKLIVFSQVEFSVRPIIVSFVFLVLTLSLNYESKPVANTNISYSSWFYVFVCSI